MEQFVGTSKTGNVKEAAGKIKNPEFLMLFDSKEGKV